MRAVLVIAATLAACAEERAGTCIDCTLGVHPAGILDPASDDFHGKELLRRNWDFGLCAKCHGESFGGKGTAPSCLTCHADGPTSCTTCHATPPATGAHATHVSKQVACGECHRVPARWDDPGHILDGNGAVDRAPAEVTFGALATKGTTPAYANGTCSNVYCHGGAFTDTAATNRTPSWTAANQATCGSCHGTPPSNHVQSECSLCHRAATHVDGIVDVGQACTSCHGSGVQPAPPSGLHGESLTTELAVGAHRAHLEAPSALRGAIACATCHLVPASVGDAGHIDTALPAEVSVALGWDRNTATCANAWCHGSARPVWTTSGAVTCGSCHGVPPADANHTPNMPLAQCASCHPRTMSASGTFLFTPGPNGPTTEHIDGDVDTR